VCPFSYQFFSNIPTFVMLPLSPAGVTAAYCVSGSCYFFVALAGYGSYGNTVRDDVLLSEPRNAKGWISTANLMVWLHVVAAYQVFSHPVFEAVETSVTENSPALARNSHWLRLGWRSLYVLVVTIVAASLPFFTDLMGLIGAMGFVPMTFIMPAVLYLVVHRGKLSRAQIVLNWAIIVTFSAIAFVSFIAAAANIAHKSSTYTFWS
jgi:amino acid permease